jgi:hypothetical protein
MTIFAKKEVMTKLFKGVMINAMIRKIAAAVHIHVLRVVSA